jgi:predicted Zn-dependent protease
LTGFATKTVAFGLAALLLASCSDLGGEQENPSLTSSWVRPEDPQEAIGAKEHPNVLATYGGVYENEKVERLVAVIVGKLVAVSDDPSRVYKITLLDTPKVNAFALPGGFLYLTRGLLALANDSSELAAVIAHEMAHVTANHAIIRQERLSSNAIAEEVVSDVLEDSSAGKVALAANRIRLSQFSQNQELQADTIGIRMTGKAGYDPYAASRFLETMEGYRRFLSGSPTTLDADSIVSNHPPTPTRVRYAIRHARNFGGPGFGERARERYLDGIDGILFGDSSEEGFVRGRVFSHAGLGIRFEVPEGFRISNEPKAVMISGPGDLLTQFDATVLSKRTDLKEYLQSGWVKGLVSETIREEKLNGLNAISAVARGEGFRFKIQLLRKGNQVYRFVTAAPQTNTNLDAVSRRITESFKLLSKYEVSQLKPHVIRIVTVKESDSVRSIASTMGVSSNKEALFRMINGMKPDSTVLAGEKVKIVAE